MSDISLRRELTLASLSVIHLSVHTPFLVSPNTRPYGLALLRSFAQCN